MAAPPQAPFLAPADALWDAVDTLNTAGLDGLARQLFPGLDGECE